MTNESVAQAESPTKSQADPPAEEKSFGARAKSFFFDFMGLIGWLVVGLSGLACFAKLHHKIELTCHFRSYYVILLFLSSIFLFFGKKRNPK